MITIMQTLVTAIRSRMIGVIIVLRHVVTPTIHLPLDGHMARHQLSTLVLVRRGYSSWAHENVAAIDMECEIIFASVKHY